jgi:RNA polymerase sigma-32 factor
MFFKLRRERVRIMNLLGDEERADQVLAEKLNLPRETLSRMLHRLEQRDLRLDAQLHDGTGLKLIDTLQSSERSQDDVAASAQTSDRVRDAVRDAIAALDERERFIVEKRLMADSEDELSLTAIGKHFGVSRERARQLESRAKHKLRTHIKRFERQSGRDFLDLGSAA